VATYVETLKLELLLLKNHLPAGIKIGHLHWGGGTPTLLSPTMINDLAQAIGNLAPFTKSYEFSVEIDPNELDDPRLDALAAAGMNRASIGVQDFDPDIQKTIGRPQSLEVTKNAVEGLRARGITSLNTDILYGLPGQTNAGISDSIQKLLALAPDRIALFGYAHVPWMARRQSMIPTDALPTPEKRLELFETARDLLSWDGYQSIGIDHFARKGDSLAVAASAGTLRRNFQGYTADTCQTMVGVGASSIAKYPQGYAQNASATSAYQKQVQAGLLPIAKGHTLTADDQLRGRIIEALMCDFQVDCVELKRDFGFSNPQLETLTKDAMDAFPDMLSLTQGILKIEEHARPLTRIIAHHFDAYSTAQAKYSSAI
jgi:oxygen-independent coproporphyrinogen-3 oxidase